MGEMGGVKTRVVVSLLRAINVAGHQMIKMEELRALYESMGLRNVRTFIQSGNVVFETAESDGTVAVRIEEAIEKRWGFRPSVIVRTALELRDVIARNPFAGRTEIEPGKLVVTFLAGDPGDEARAKVRAMKTDPEEMRIEGSEIFTYFPNGMGKSKLSAAAIDRALKIPGTSRNWNTVMKLLAMAEEPALPSRNPRPDRR
jgi:uncharacterized protein (DUF1697 family)